MAMMMIAGLAEFNLEQISNLLPDEFNPIVEAKTGGDILTLKGETTFIAQIEACDQEQDDDTMDDLKGLADLPAAFSEALKGRQLRFLIVTYSTPEEETLRRMLDLMAKAGVAQFFIDGSDTVHDLAK